MNRRRLFPALMVIAGLSSVFQSSVLATCWYPDEIQADQVKDFQYMLMVGALRCGTATGPSRDAYDAFVVSKRSVLDSKAYVLKAHFLRENGIQSGRAAYDSYATVMSNRHAGRFDDASFCSTISSYTRMAATSSDQDFVTLAQSVIEPPSGSCEASGYTAAAAPPRRTDTGYAPDPASRSISYPNDTNYPLPGYAVSAPAYAEPAAAYYAQPALAYTQPAPGYAEAVSPRAERSAQAPLLQPLAVAEPAAPPLVARAMTASRTTVIAAAPIVPPDEGGAASSAQALQTAIIALQAATEALRAQIHPSN